MLAKQFRLDYLFISPPLPSQLRKSRMSVCYVQFAVLFISCRSVQIVLPGVVTGGDTGNKDIVAENLPKYSLKVLLPVIGVLQSRFF